MKITIEFDSGDVARGAPAVTVASAPATAPMAVPVNYVEATHVGAIDAGPGPGVIASTGVTVAEPPEELAAQAAAIGAVSAGPAPNLD